MHDYFHFDERLRDLVSDVRVVRGAEYDSGHFLVASEVHLSKKWTWMNMDMDE